MQPASREDIRDYLLSIKRVVSSEPEAYEPLVVVKRQKNMECLAQLGLTLRNIRDILLDLTVEEYCSGPERDYGGFPGDFWVFGKSIGGKEVYIKLKLVELSSLRVVRIVSFHFPDETMIYPYAARPH
ncbi:MAG: hypothetical protein R6U89_10820 [Dehalococcoidia bacterium]